MENLLKQLEDLRERLSAIWKLLDIDRQIEKVNELKFEMSKPDFWSDQNRAIDISKKAEELEKENLKWQELKDQITEAEELSALAEHENNGSMDEELYDKYEELKNKLNQFEFFVLFSGKYDSNNAIITIHSGTGGVDAQDWAEILERMFLRFAEKKGWQTEILDRTVGNEAGIKNVTIKVSGRWAYGYLRSESGVHRLVRISPFDAEGMRHTSFALLEVIPELPEAEEIILKEDELRIDVFRSSGPGGQSVNRTESAVRIVHLPTNITVSCQNERSQHQNKENCLKILKSKLYQLREEEEKKEELRLKGESMRADWGKQIRSYVMQPYQLVKDHRTNFEATDIRGVLDGELDGFMEAYLRQSRDEQTK